MWRGCETSPHNDWDGNSQLHDPSDVTPALQEYMDLGPAYVEHVASLRFNGLPLAVPKLCSALFNYTDQDYMRVVEPLEMLALLHCTATLVRRCKALTGQYISVARGVQRLQPALHSTLVRACRPFTAC